MKMKTNLCMAMLILLLFTPLTTVTEARTEEVTVVDARGIEVTFDAPPERIVSFMASNTELLFHLGLGDRVVAVDDYSDHPAEVRGLPKVGDAFTINYELIVDMAADVVVTAVYNTDMIDYLEGIGQRVVATGATTVDDIYGDMVLLGRMCGIESQAEEMADGLRDEMARLTEDTRELSPEYRPRVLYVVSTYQGIWTTGGGTFQNTLLTNAGGNNIASEKVGWIALSEEEILVANPEVIIATETVKNDLCIILEKTSWSEISAVKNENVFYVDDDIMSRPGPRVVEAQGTLVEFISGVMPEEDIRGETHTIGTVVVLATIAAAAVFTERKRR